MTHPIPFTFLGFYFNSLVDSGETESISLVMNKLETNSMFEYLNEKYSENFDVSLFTKNQLKEIEKYFNMLAGSMDERRKMGIENNGLCLLVGYCLEAAQKKVEDLNPPFVELYKK